MPRLASNELTQRLQARVQMLSYGDLAYYYGPLGDDAPLDEYGHPTGEITPVKVECSVNDAVGKRRMVEAWTDAIDIARLDAEIRFGPNVIVPTKGGKFVITQRHDNPEYADHEFEIIGIQDRGNMGFLCALHRVEI